MAGRGKDFAFIKELLNGRLVEIETLITRAELVANMPQSDALTPRLEKLEAYGTTVLRCPAHPAVT